MGIILKIHPKSYEKTHLNCGRESVKAILSAYGKPFKIDSRPLWESIQGLTLPRSAVKMLKANGIEAERKNAANLSPDQRLRLLEGNLLSGRPVMLLIKAIPAHWITVWGYDEEVFFIYDSSKLASTDAMVPIGNTKKSKADLLRLWKGTPWLSWFFPRYLYIEIKQEA